MGARANTSLDKLMGCSRGAMARRIANQLEREGIGTKTGTMSENNLKKQIGKLAKGDGDWWADAEHAPARVAFQALLPSVAGYMPDQDGTSGVFHFDEFPELPALQLTEQQPPLLGSPSIDEISSAEGAHWLVMPRGTGRTLFVSWLGAQEGLDVVARSVETLADGAALAADLDSLLVLDVQRSDDDDEGAVSVLRGRRDVVVLACFEPPKGVPYRRSGQAASNGSLVSKTRGSSSIIMLPSDIDQWADKNTPHWLVTEWRAWAGWRRWFVGWCASRIDQPNFDPNDVADALDAVDSHERWFDTPAAVLPIIAAAQRGALPRSHTVRAWAGSRLASRAILARTGSAEDPWLSAHGADCAVAMVEALVDRVDLPLVGALGIEDVSSMIGPTVATSTGHVERAIRAAIATGDDHLDELTATMAGDAQTAVQRMIVGGLLTRESATTVTIQPSWIVGMVADKFIRARIINASPHAWGRWCLEPTRRELVDVALDDLRGTELRRLVTRVLDDHNPTNLGSVASVEAMFAVVARRMDTKKLPLDGGLLQRLWVAQHAQIASRYEDSIPAPLTRNAPGDGGDACLEWVANCWSWSLAVPRPDTDIDGMEWLLPGWTHPAWSTAPKWMHGHISKPSMDQKNRDEWSPRFLRVLRLGPKVAARAVGPVGKPPTVFYPFLASHPDVEGDLTEIVNAVLTQESWAHIEFGHWSDGASPSRLRTVGAHLLDTLGSEKGALFGLRILAHHAPRVHDALEEEVVLRVVSDHQDEVVKQPEALATALPIHMRTKVLRDLIQRVPGLGEAIRKALPDHLGIPLEFEVHLDLLRLDLTWPLWPVARAAWRDATRDDVLRATIEEIPTGSEIGRVLWFEAPEDVRVELVKMICEGELVAPEVKWFERYLRRAVFAEPAIAERAFGLLQLSARETAP